MTNDIKTEMLTNLKHDIVNLSATIVAISAQGYVVNVAKYSNLKAMSLVARLLEEYDSFNKKEQAKINLLYNLL